MTNLSSQTQDAAKTSQAPEGLRPMALLFGILIAYAGAIFIPFFFSWYQIGLYETDYSSQITANALVPLALGMVFALVAAVNPLLRKFAPGLGLGRRELFIIFSLWALTCVITSKDIGARVFSTAGTMMGRGVNDKTANKIKFREELLPNRKIFLPEDPKKGVNASTKYYFGLSSDSEHHISPFPRSPLLLPEEIIGLTGLAKKLSEPADPLSTYLAGTISPETLGQLAELKDDAQGISAPLLNALNAAIAGDVIYTQERFANVDLGEEIIQIIASQPRGDAAVALNRMLIERAYPQMLVRRGTDGDATFSREDLRNPSRLVQLLFRAGDPVTRYLRGSLDAGLAKPMAAYAEKAGIVAGHVAKELNAILAAGPLYDANRFKNVSISKETEARAKNAGPDSEALAINRSLIQEAYRDEIGALPPVVPWHLWKTPLLFWGSLIIVFIAFSMSLVRAMHRQWSKHELLTYPIAAAMDSVVGIKRGRLWPEIFYDRIFWYGFGMMVFIFGINGLNRWFSQMISVPMRYAYYDLIKEFHFLSKYCGREAYSFFRGVLYPFMAAIAVLLPTEVSLTCWLGYALMIFGTGFYFLFTGEVITSHETTYIQSGMHVALALVVLIIGRREYFNVLRCALFVHKPEDDMQRSAANAARVFIGCFFLLAGLFGYAGLDWFQALVLTSSFGLMVLLIARVTAEAGVPWLVNFTGQAVALPFQMLGAATLGPAGLAVLYTTGSTLHAFTSNSIAAQETTISKLREPGKGWFNGGGFTLVVSVGILLALTSTVFFQLWDNYSFGARKQSHAVKDVASKMATGAKEISRLDVEFGIDKISKGSGLQRVKEHWQFDKVYWRFFALGAAAVFICAFLRLRFSWWPFHPLPLIFINSWAMSRMAYPTMIGWLIKTAILRVWGGKAYTKARPFFYGIIIGQVVVLMFWALISVIYHLVTGMTPTQVFGF